MEHYIIYGIPALLQMLLVHVAPSTGASSVVGILIDIKLLPGGLIPKTPEKLGRRGSKVNAEADTKACAGTVHG